MGNLCEDLWVEILGRLSSEKNLVRCMRVSRTWQRITCQLWIQRFWAQSPPLGLFFRTSTTVDNQVLRRMNYISLYNYHTMEDNLERDYVKFVDDDRYMSAKSRWEFYRHWYKRGPRGGITFQPVTDRDEYLNGCNGLILMLKSSTHQYYVCNPITGQQVAIPKACVHINHGDRHCCAALAFDPSESGGYFRVVRIDYSVLESVVIDIFSSEYGLWVRHDQLKIDPGFIEGFKNSNLCRHFVYLRGKLYSIAQSWNILCIDLSTIAASTLQLPLTEDDKTGAMGCLGVSRDSLCYMKRMPDHHWYEKGDYNLVIWYYDHEPGEWILRYPVVSCRWLGYGIESLNYDYDDSMEPCAISPTSDLLFFATAKLICCFHLESKKMKFVIGEPYNMSNIDQAASFLTLRACFVPLYTHRNKRDDGSTACGGRESTLSVEVPQEDGESVEVIDVELYDIMLKEPSPALVYPSEIMEMHLELGRPKRCDV